MQYSRIRTVEQAKKFEYDASLGPESEPLCRDEVR